MHRVTIVLDDELMAEIDAMVGKRGYQNRSEAVRDLARAGLRRAAEDADVSGDCIAALAYSYDHGERNLAKRLAKTFHDAHDLTVSALHVHLNHDTCVEVSVLQGETGAVRKLADKVVSERGVRHGRLTMMPVEPGSDRHVHHGAGTHRHTHRRLRKAG